MILDTMTYSVMIVVAVLAFTVILLAGFSRNQQNNRDK